jgi:hypothetical protein
MTNGTTFSQSHDPSLTGSIRPSQDAPYTTMIRQRPVAHRASVSRIFGDGMEDRPAVGGVLTEAVLPVLVDGQSARHVGLGPVQGDAPRR